MNLERWPDLIFDKLHRWLTTFIRMLPNLAIAVLIVTAGFFAGKLIRKLAFNITLKITHSDSASGVVAGIVNTLVLFLSLTIALGVLNLDGTVSSLLAGVGIIGLALGFAFQDLSSNFISGLFMAFKRPFEIGDQVETNSFSGIIHDIKLRATTLHTHDGLHVIIPNKDIFQKPIINHTRSESRRVELEFSVNSATDLSYAESVIRDALTAAGGESQVSDVDVFFTGIDEPKIKLMVSFKVNHAERREFLKQRHFAIRAIYKAFGEKEIVKITTPGSQAKA